MPFTPAHPAIVLPFIRLNPRYVSATGLIIGSMSPDFEYFIKMSVDSTHSHTLPGLFYLDVPLTILLAFAFHLVAKRNLILNLPCFLQKRFQPLLGLNFADRFKRHTVAILMCALLGAASHVFWDGFTHNNGYFAERIESLRILRVPFQGVNYPLFYALQHISTATGLAILLIYIAFMKPATSAIRNKPSAYYWLGLALITGLTVLIRFSIWPSDYNLGNLVVSSITGICLGLIILGLAMNRQKNEQRFG